MNDFLKLPTDKRRTIYEQVSLRMGIHDAKAIEKDIWVTNILQCVFMLPYANALVFKGGSSLSKIWNLIFRFSEDIDLAIDRSLFGMEGDLTKKQLKNLRKASSVFVRDVFSKDLQSVVQLNGLADYCSVSADPDGEGKEHGLPPDSHRFPGSRVRGLFKKRTKKVIVPAGGSLPRHRCRCRPRPLRRGR